MMRKLFILGLLAALPAGAQAHDLRGLRTTWDPPQGVRIGTAPDGTFVVYVASNISTDGAVRKVAATTAGRYCIAEHGTNRIRFERVRRHSDLELAAWMFAGRCV